MGINLKGRSFLTLRDYSAEEIEYLVDLAIDLKEKKKKGIFERHLANKNVALIFSWDIKRRLKIRQGYWEECSTE